MEASQQRSQPHVAIVPTPGMGHLYPLIEFAKRLVEQHNFIVTFAIANDGKSSIELQKKLLQALPKPISSLFLPPVNMDDLPDGTAIETRIELSLVRSLPALRESLKAMVESTWLVALVVDNFGPCSFDLAKELGIPPYIFIPMSAVSLSMFFHLPKLDAATTSDFGELSEPIKLPGCVPLQGRDLFDVLYDRNSEACKAFIRMVNRYYEAAGVIVNSSVDLTPGAFKALQERVYGNPPVYPVGPLVRSSSTDEGAEKYDCLTWLDKQPSDSVLFVSFGSGGTVSQEQLTELAFGLERSRQRFLWVVKSPHEKSSSASFFSATSIKNPLEYLPEGFLERTKEVGLVVPSWAPQVQVLSNGATGGFLSHCGWNSSLESIVNGVPLIAWPLFAEQMINAVLLSEELKIAVRVKKNDRGIVGREDIAKYARELIEGEEGKAMRNKVKELQAASKVALSHEGSSTKSLAEVARIWTSPKA